MAESRNTILGKSGRFAFRKSSREFLMGILASFAETRAAFAPPWMLVGGGFRGLASSRGRPRSAQRMPAQQEADKHSALPKLYAPIPASWRALPTTDGSDSASDALRGRSLSNLRIPLTPRPRVSCTDCVWASPESATPSAAVDQICRSKHGHRFRFRASHAAMEYSGERLNFEKQADG
jgi:hypothetical protein